MLPANSVGSGSSTPSNESLAPILGDEAQALISCNQKLQELGIDDTISLPRIVVIGDQSTGKSSLIEAISTIKVPKAANLCTKCPIAINLSSGKSPTSPWTCSVYVEEKFRYNAAFKQKRVSKAHPLGPWQLSNEVKTTLIKTADNRDELSELIDTAQQILLNPDRVPGDPLMHDVLPNNLERFSPNTIRLDISVGGWPNLSFVDLPGVIQSAGRGQPDYYVQLVESLAKQYAQDEDNIIMLTLPINHDVSNSRSYSVIQKQNAQSRTMAVFTKVDLARDEERNDCLRRYFSDEVEEEFEHGHHMVMLSNATDTTQEHGLAEAAFFSLNPWASLPDSVKARLGVVNLTKLLRQILFQKTADTLPSNLEKIRERFEMNEQQLANMPAPPDTSELPYQLRDQIKDFGMLVKQIFTSSHDGSRSNARSALNRLMQDFSTRIRGDKPTMLIKTEDAIARLAKAERKLQGGTSTNPVAVDAETDGDSKTVSRTPQKQQPASSPSKTTRVQRFRLEEIREINSNYYQASVPGEIELKALETMNRMSVQYWGVTLNEFMHKVNKVVKGQILEHIDNHFGHQKHLQLYSTVQTIAKNYLELVIHEEWSGLDRICDAELKYPLTFNQESLKKHELDSIAVRRQKRAEARLVLEQTLLKATNMGKKIKTLTIDDLPPDSWDVEVQMSAKTRAYYEIASSRFVDTICQNIFVYLIPRCQEALVNHVREQLGLHDVQANKERIAILMAEDAEREAYRARLRGEQDRLEEGYTYIQKVLGIANMSDLRMSSQTGIEEPVDAVMSDEKSVPISAADGPIASPSKRKVDTYINGVDMISPSKRGRNATVEDSGFDVGSGSSSERRNGIAVRLQSVGLHDDE